jgi:hypothetical protein
MASNHSCLVNIASAMLLVVTGNACQPTGVVRSPAVIAPPIVGATLAGSQRRDARGGGYVTVEFGIVPGQIPRLDNMSGSATTVAWFRNQGQDGKRENRYDLDPSPSIHYELELSPVAGGRTLWTMWEVNRRTNSRVRHQDGRLWTCHKYNNPSTVRETGFRDCDQPTSSLPSTTESFGLVNSDLALSAFVSSPAEASMAGEDAPAWIRCDYGCCSLNQS